MKVKTKKRHVSRNKRKRRVSRKKQRGGDYSAILRKNAHKHGDKDIKKYQDENESVRKKSSQKQIFKANIRKT